MISDYEQERKDKKAAPAPRIPRPSDPSRSDGLRAAFTSGRQEKDNKMRRIFASPAQVSRTEEGIVIGPRGETTLEKAQREAKEARRLADEARAAL
jgi:hypothetical protein